MFAYLDSVVCLHSRIICVGTKNWQSSPQHVTALADLLSISVSVVKDEGRNISKQYVSANLDRWLS
jgi:hypothetical protein